NPWRTVTFGISRLTAGDTLNIRGGTYYERPTASVSGTASAPITIQSYSGEQVVIDSGGPEFRTPGNSDWELVNASLGEYRSVASFSSGQIAAYVDGIPGYYNERVGLVPYTTAAAFRSTSEVYVDGSTPFYIGPGTFRDSDSRIHIRLAKTQDMRDVESRYGTIFPTENADPRAYGIILSNASDTLAVSGSYLTFKNITFNQALQTITLSTGTNNVIFDGITAWFGNRTISVTGSGVYNITIRNSRIYGDIPLWIAWSDAKDPPAPADLWRGTSINLASGARDVTISYSHIRGGHDGIGMNTDEKNVTLHHNRIENFADDCFEIEGTTNIGRIEMYENYFANCLDMLSVGQDSAAITGPVLLYRNIASFLRNPYVNRKDGINTWNGGGKYGYEYMFKQGGGNLTGNIHYTHNTFVMLNTGSGNGMNFGRMTVPSGSTLANNVAVMVVGKINTTYPSSGSGALINGNLYWKVIPRITGNTSFDTLLSSYTTVPAFSSATGYEQNGTGATIYQGTNPAFSTLAFPALSSESDPNQRRFLASSFERHVPADFLLSASSPACGGGVTIQGRNTTNLNGAAIEQLRDSRGFDTGLGAIPCGTLASEYDVFPFVTTAGVPSDTTAPSITNVVASGITGSSVTVTWNTNEVADREVEYGTTTAYGQSSLVSSNFAASHSVSLANLSPNTLYHYRVKSRDAAGNLAVSSDATFTTLSAGVDTSAPTIPLGLTATPISGSQINLSWTASTDNSSVAGYKILRSAANSGPYVQIATSVGASYSDTGLSAQTPYYYVVQAYDAAGNTSLNSTQASAATLSASTQPSGTTLTFTPIADATLKLATPTTNFGTDSKLEADASPVEEFLFKFSVSGIGSQTVASAKLRLYNINPSDKGGDIRRVTDSSWSETSVTAANAPAADASVVTSLGPVVINTWYEADITSLVASDGIYSMKVTSASTDGADYTSREGAAGFRPELVVSLGQQVIPSGDTSAPTGVGNVFPTHGATNISTTPTLMAAAATDATPPVSYYFELYTGGVCSGTPVQTRSYLSDTTWSPNTLASATVHAWRHKARDSATPANESAFGPCASFATTPPADTTPPVRSGGEPIGPLSAGTTQTVLSLTTDENATCRYGITANTAYSSLLITFATTGGSTHSSQLNGLQNGTTQAYYVRCQDAADNINTTDYTISFQVLTSSVSQTDTTPPVIHNVQSTNITQTTATIRWDTDESANSTVEFGVASSFGQASSTNGLVTSHTIILGNLSSNTQYTYRVKSTDTFQNTGTGQTNAFTTLSSINICTEAWTCTEWSACSSGTQTRTCTDANSCGTTTSRPVTSQSCSMSSPASGGGGGGGSVVTPNPSGSTQPPTTSGTQQTPTQASSGSKASCTSGRNQDAINAFIAQERLLVRSQNVSLRNRLLGYILLQVESHGEAWYLDIVSKVRYYLADGCSAYDGLRRFGLGITNADLEKIPVGIEPRFADTDSDGDGLPDKMEEGLGTDPQEPDTDEDGFLDGTEVLFGYNPKGSGILRIDRTLTNRLRGRILLQVQAKGQAWYINPKDSKRYYMKNGEAAYQIMRFLSLGITNRDLEGISIGE
ncbi:MAG: fibronectin type III domain-containing protein, partial [Patescibacteria group bacterium]